MRKKTLWSIIIFTLLLVGVGNIKAYVVQSGDTMSKIAYEADLSLSELAELNPQVENLDLIHVGEEINTLFEEAFLGGTRPTSPIAGATYNLAGSGLTSSATTIVLQKLTIPQTGRELLDEDFSDLFFVTLEAGNQKRQEIVSCTTVTQGSGTTATLSGCTRGLLPFYPFTASSTYRFSHGGGTSVIFSDPPQLFEQYTSKNSTSTISALWDFSVIPSSSDECTETDEFCTKTYIDNSSNQGAATSTESVAGISELATQIEMASTTDNGVNDPLVLQAKYATSTPQVNGLYLPVSQNNGFLHQGWLNLAENFVVTGGWTFGNTTTTAASSTSFFSTTVSTTALFIDSVAADNLVGGNDADSLHIHPQSADAFNSTYFNYSRPAQVQNWETVGGSFVSTTVFDYMRLTGGIFRIWTNIAPPNGGVDTIAQFDDTQDTIAQFRLRLIAGPSNGSQLAYGFTEENSGNSDWGITTAIDDNVTFIVKDTGSGDQLFAQTGNSSATSTSEITGVTLSNWNSYRIDYDPGVDAKFYVNGTLEATITATLPNAASDIWFGAKIYEAGQDLFLEELQVSKEL